MPSIGKDLAAIRSHLGFTIQDIQYATKIPVSTLQTIENDSIFTRQDESKTYIRSFVRSYGRALKIEDELMIKALDQFESGNYNHLLLQEFQNLTNKERDTVEGAKDQVPVTDEQPIKSKPVSDSEDLFSSDESSIKLAAEKDESADTVHKANATEIKSGISNQKISDNTTSSEGPGTSGIEPAINSVDWANVGQKYSSDKNKISAWLISIIILVVIAAAGIYILYQSGFFGSENQDDDTVTSTEMNATRGGLSLDLEEPPAEAAEPETLSALDDVLHITVYAALGLLDPVRVWSDLKPRLDPYWLEQGAALEFEFADTVRIRGNYANMLLFKNGHLIQNFYDEFFEEEENAVELTRNFFNSDPKWATPIPLELPNGVDEPTSINPRPSF